MPYSLKPGTENYGCVDAAVIKAGAQNAQLTDFFAVLVILGVFKVFEPVQL
jgi:hypothetical protein